MNERTDNCVVVFAAKSVDRRILDEGGTSSWILKRDRALKCVVAVCVRNAKTSWGERSDHPHRSAFLVGKVRNVVLASPYDRPYLKEPPHTQGRYLIEFSEYALVSIENVKGHRKSVNYVRIEALGVDLSALKWEPIRQVRGSVR